MDHEEGRDMPETPRPQGLGQLFSLQLEEGYTTTQAVVTAVLTRAALLKHFHYTDDANVYLHDEAGVVQGTLWQLFIQWAVSRWKRGYGPSEYRGVTSGLTVCPDAEEQRSVRIELLVEGKGTSGGELQCRIYTKPDQATESCCVKEFYARLVPVERILKRKKPA